MANEIARSLHQAPRDDFIVDFARLRYRLIIEIDGGQHNRNAHALRDAARDWHFASQGFNVLRFWNNDIDHNLEGVLMLIDDVLQKPPPGAQVSAAASRTSLADAAEKLRATLPEDGEG